MPGRNEARKALLARLFPKGIPRLWCPLISHYREDGSFDAERIRAHVAHLAPQVQGFLLPGSTGDGWELEDAEIRALLEIALQAAADFDLRLLIGVLKTDARAAARTISTTVTWLSERSGRPDMLESLEANRVCGFTVCPPKGEERTQGEIAAELSRVLELGVPVSLYQLPQVTENEMTPETVATLAAEHENFILFKDTSGGDRVVASGLDLGGVFSVRGAEGGYARWTKFGGGPYDGLLLSTANTLAAPLARVLDLCGQGDSDAAAELSRRLSATADEAFAAVAKLEFGNPFANANKAMDHHMAYGPKADGIAGPLTHAGVRLPQSVIRSVREALRRGGLLPGNGYLG